MNDLHDHESSAQIPRYRGATPKYGGWCLGLFGAPLAWVAQVYLSEPLAAHACYPYQTPLSASLWQNLPAMLAAISITCLVVALLSGVKVWTLWRQTIGKPVPDGYMDRERFLLSLASMSSFLFILAIVFNICALWLVSPCNPWP